MKPRNYNKEAISIIKELDFMDTTCIRDIIFRIAQNYPAALVKSCHDKVSFPTVDALLIERKKIEAIREYRSLTDWDFHSARDWVYKREEELKRNGKLSHS